MEKVDVQRILVDVEDVIVIVLAYLPAMPLNDLEEAVRGLRPVLPVIVDCVEVWNPIIETRRISSCQTHDKGMNNLPHLLCICWGLGQVGDPD